jgi:anaerobic ribonucleoside-triphosphate reductase
MLLQDKLWQLDKSWENNLVFYGINIPRIEEEEGNPKLVEDKVREILRISLGIGREVPILRAKRAFTGANIRGSKPITVYFQKYADKEEILR